jgi:hypothetical protein
MVRTVWPQQEREAGQLFKTVKLRRVDNSEDKLAWWLKSLRWSTFVAFLFQVVIYVGEKEGKKEGRKEGRKEEKEKKEES